MRETSLSLRAWPPTALDGAGFCDTPPPYVVAGSRYRLGSGAEDDG